MNNHRIIQSHFPEENPAEDSALRDLFSAYSPTLADDARFITMLERNLDALEVVKEHERQQQRRNRVAIAIALVVGFVAGCLFSLLLPWLGEAVRNWRVTLPGLPASWLATHYFPIALTLIGATSILISLNTFELTTYLLRRR